MANHDSFWRLGEQLRLQANLRGNDSGNGNSRFIMDKFNMPNLSNLSLEEQPSSKFNKAEFKKNSYDKQPTASSRSKFKNKHTHAHTPNNGDWNFGEGVQKPAQNNNNDKRFKSLPPSESLPRNETLGGYIFVCNNDTMQDDLKSLLFGLPQRYRDSVRAITPGLPLFLYNYTTHQLHGIFEAASFGGTNIDPTAWEDKKCPGESRFPAQVRIRTRKLCKPLEEDAFRPVLHHYDGPKFRLQLNVPETLALLDICNENGPP